VQTPPYELLAKPSIKSLKELKGKTVSIGGPKDVASLDPVRWWAQAQRENSVPAFLVQA
jgi:hypothetical protein